MSILNLIKFPDPILNKKVSETSFFDNKLYININNLIETMFYYNALGIAANQVNINQRIIIINLSNEEYYQHLTLINPKIFNSYGSSINEEGCLSFPEIFLRIKRKKNIFIKFYSYKNNIHYLKCDKMISVCIQHEIDHLNGITMYDRVNNIKKKIILKKFL